MAKGNALEDFAKKPLGFQIGVFVGIAVVLGGLYWYLFYSELSAQLDSELSSNKSKLSKKKKLGVQLKERQALLKENNKLKKELGAVGEALPTSSELPAFFRQLDRQAATAGVTITKRSLAKEIPVPPYVKVPVSIEMQGSFYQIARYFSLLGDPKKTNRIITIESLSMSEGQRRNDETVLRAKFKAATFRMEDGSGLDEGAKEEEAKTKKKPKGVKEGSKAKVKAANDKRGKQLDGAGKNNAKAGVDRLKKP